MAKIDISKVDELLEKLSVNNETHEIKFSMLPVNTTNVREENGTKLFDLRSSVDVLVKKTGESVSFVADLLKVPFYGEAGFTVKGKAKQVISQYTMSYGWYVMPASNSFKTDHLKLQSEKGPSLIIYSKDYELRVTAGKKMNDPSVSLAVFLKAFTGKSFSELIQLVGAHSVYVLKTFSGREPLRVECIDKVVMSLLPEYASGRKDEEYGALGTEDRLAILRSRFLSPEKMYLGNTAGVRLKRTLSYKYRCKNLYLSKSLESNGHKFDEGISLDSRVLDSLDYLPVDSITVSSSDRKKFVVRKQSILNFRALGCTLEEDIELNDRVLKQGTVLGLYDLKDLEQTTLSKIKVSFEGKSFDSVREIPDGSFKIDDVISMVQVFLDSLGGLNLYDNIYSLTNQNLDNLDIRLADLLKRNCNLLISRIMDNSFVFSGGADLLTKVLSAEPLDTDGLIKFIESPETRESQQAEVNNIIQKTSKDHRVSKNVKRSSAGMGSVQESQFGRLDAVESPESSKIGTVHSMTYFSKVNENGFMTAPFIRVSNGEVVSEEPVYLTSEEQEHELVASWDETFMEEDENGNLRKKEKVLVMSSSTFLYSPIEDVNYKQVGPYDTMSPARLMSPFPEHSQPKRLLMSASQTKQSLPLINNERPRVSSGGESLLKEGIVWGRDILTEYYRINKSKLSMTLEEFLTKKIRLINTQIVSSSKVLSFSIEGLDGHVAQTEIPYLQKAASGGLFSYIINTNTDVVYDADTIVAHSSDIDIRKYDVNIHANFGHMKVDKRDFEKAVGLSRNFNIVFKTFEGSTIDDAILIGSHVIDSGDLSAMDLHTVTYELKQDSINRVSGQIEEESFGFINEPPTSYLDVTGLPKVGSRLKPGDIVIGVKVEKKQANRTEGIQLVGQPTNKHIVLEDSAEGEVVSAKIEGRKAIVMLGTIRYAEQGDKMAGRHGNKGVISRVVPWYDMPFDPETGEPVDICLNPQGIPSRGNISQILEAHLGAAMKKQGQIQVISPYVGDTLEYVLEMCEKNGIKPKTLRDGRTGRDFERPATVVNMYMLYLEHRVAHKIKYVGISSKLDPVFNQPSKGGGGQAFGEMETWVLEAAGARKIMQDIFSLQSDDLEAINEIGAALARNATDVEVEGENHNDKIFQVIMRCLGVEPQYDSEGNLWFKPLTDAMTRALNVHPVDINNKASLESADIFGVTSNHMMKFKSRTTWSWIPLHTEIVHPFYIVKGRINKFFMAMRTVRKKNGDTSVESLVATEDMLKDIIAGRQYAVISSTGIMLVDGPTEEAETGMQALVKLLRIYDMANTKGYLQTKINNAKSTSSVIKLQKDLRQILDFEESGTKLQDFIISTLPIMPLSFRPRSKLDHVLQDFDFYYGRILDEVSKYMTSSVRSNDNVYSIYLRIAEFCGLSYGKETQINDQYKPLIKYFTGREGPDSKHGRLRENTVKKRSLFAGRTVIVPSSDISRPPTKIGLPFRMVVKMYSSHLLPLLRKNFDAINLSLETWRQILDVIGTNHTAFNNIVRFNEHVIGLTPDEFYDKVYAVISAFIEGYSDPETGEVIVRPQIVMAGRQPSLHKFSIRAYEVVIVHGMAIEIHPLVCPGYNADFDGDQMHVEALINTAAQQEALEKLSPKKGIINPKDGSIVVKHSQDILLGIYFATMLKDNVDHISKHETYQEAPYVYTDIRTLSDDIDLGIVHVYDLVCYVKDDNVYLSTAGRILFNSYLPDNQGFTEEQFTNPLEIPNIKVENYKQLKFDGLVAGNGGSRKTPHYVSMKAVVSWLCDNFDEDKTMDCMQKLSEFGFKQADMSAISLSIYDLVQNPKTDKFLAKADEMAKIINDRYFKGVLSEKERKAELIYLYKETKGRIKKTFMADFDRNNNMFIMFDSGARGNEDQIMQACGVIGILQKTKDEVLETPVLSNYTKGTTAFETLQLSYSTRVGVASTQNETADSGELTRLAVYMGGGFRIKEHDCGSEGDDLKLWWTEPTGYAIDPAGKIIRVDQLIGRKLVGPESVLVHLAHFNVEDRVITDRSVDILLKKKIQRINLEDGEYSISYKLDSFMKSLLKYRFTSDNLPSLIDGNYISDKTIGHVAKANLESVKIRTMLSCKTVGGACQKCYGLAYDTKKLPPIGTAIGVESAQAIGEPANQLSLSLFHTGGEAGKGADKGVLLYKSVLERGFSDKLQRAKLASKNGYVTIAGDRRRPLVGDAIHYTQSELIVENGEFVDRNEPLSVGFIVPEAENLVNLDQSELNFIRMSLLNIHFRIFEMNNISVYARHFELFARVQTSIVTVMNSEDPKFKFGMKYQLNDILQNAEGHVDYVFDVSKKNEIVEHFGGPHVLMCLGHLAGHLGRFTTSGKRSKISSFTGDLLVGQDVTGGPRKVFVSPKDVSVHASSNDSNKFFGEMEQEEESKVAEMLMSSAFVKEVESVDVSIDESDFADLLGDLTGDFEEDVKPAEIDLDNLDDEEESSNSVSDNLKSLKAF